MNIPDNLLYTKEHEWARLEARLATVGISDFAQSSLGDITFIELPKIGAEVKQFSRLSTVESVKAASDIYAPFSGKVVKINDDLSSSPELLNKSPFSGGWLCVIEIKDEGEKRNLLPAKDYKAYVEGLK